MASPPQTPHDYRTGVGDRLLAALLTAGLAGILVKVSLLNYGAVLAPAVSAVVSVVILGIRRTLGPGQARAVLSGFAAGAIIVTLAFGTILVILLIALSNRGE